MIDAAKLASAHRITAVIPWYGTRARTRSRRPASRSPPASSPTAADRRRRPRADDGPPRRPGAGLLRRAGGPHDRAADVRQHFRDLASSGDGVVVVSPDAGRAKLAKKFAEMLGTTWRSSPRSARATTRPGHENRVIGDVSGRVAIIFDDMIDTAGTLCAGAQAVEGGGRHARRRLRDARPLFGPATPWRRSRPARSTRSSCATPCRCPPRCSRARRSRPPGRSHPRADDRRDLPPRVGLADLRRREPAF